MEDPDIKLLPGEEIVFQGQDVTHLCPYKGPTPGRLVITSYQFAFVGADGTQAVVPLGAVERVDKVGGITSRGEYSYGLEIICKDLRSIRIAHRQENHSRRSPYEALQIWAFPLSSNKKLFALSYKGVDGSGQPSKGWKVYDYRREMQRQGVPNERWRISTLNADFSLSATYPPLIAVPADLDDETLAKSAQFRSKCRFQALSWIHRDSQATITRCSQPRVGMTGKRNAEDEGFIQSIRQQNPLQSAEVFCIFDARPKRNAVANQAKGMGYEFDSNYPNCQLAFLNIHNIHVMRSSLKGLRDLCQGNLEDTHWFSTLESTNWLKHIKAVLSGAVRVVNAIERDISVLVHCSDGWDRTAQLTALAMVMLDPYYRTIEGFEVLIEKEWLEFGHKFGQRLGHGDSKHPDERSPVFLQFLDCVWQITKQFPCAFEFNEHFLISIADHMYSCLFGTFLLNNHQERLTSDLHSTTHSLWDLFSAAPTEYTNPLFAPAMHSNVLPVKAGLKSLSLWTAYYLRWAPSLRPQESVDKRTRELQALCSQLEKECAALEGQQDGHIATAAVAAS